MYDLILLNERKLYRLMEIISYLSRETDIKSFLIQSKTYLSQLICAEQTQIFLYENHHKVLLGFQQNESETPVIISDLIGIVGFVVEHKNIYETNDPKRDLNYNPQLDLNTELPLLTVPVLDEDNMILGIFQVTNLKNHAEKKLGKVKSVNYDLMALYAKFLSNCFRTIMEKNQKELYKILNKFYS